MLLGDEVCINAKEKKRIAISVLTEEKKPRIKWRKLTCASQLRRYEATETCDVKRMTRYEGYCYGNVTPPLFFNFEAKFRSPRHRFLLCANLLTCTVEGCERLLLCPHLCKFTVFFFFCNVCILVLLHFYDSHQNKI